MESTVGNFRQQSAFSAHNTPIVIVTDDYYVKRLLQGNKLEVVEFFPEGSSFKVRVKLKWPPIDHGTRVKTTKPNEKLKGEWAVAAWNSRQWGVSGTVVAHHDSHGLSYEV